MYTGIRNIHMYISIYLYACIFCIYAYRCMHVMTIVGPVMAIGNRIDDHGIYNHD